jgi:transporter family-2 protein
LTAVEMRPRGVAGFLASPPRALALTILAGAAISVQSYVNGRLGSDIGSPVIAGAINNLVALVAAVAIVLATTATLDAMPGNPLLYAGGLRGAFVVVTATAVQTLGVLRSGSRWSRARWRVRSWST